MGDFGILLLIFGVLVLVTWFVRRKANKAGGFLRWLWMAVFGAVSAFLVYVIFMFFVHMESWVLKQLTMFIVIALVTPTAGYIGGMVYDKRR